MIKLIKASRLLFFYTIFTTLNCVIINFSYVPICYNQATKDPYYLTVGKHVIETLEAHARVKCGFAALKDLRTLDHEDK